MVVAIGGNSLIPDRDHVRTEDQYRAICHTAEQLVDTVAAGCELVITHGNGPQVGFILRRGELAREFVHEVPLDSVDADTQGALGYHIQQALGNSLRLRGLDDRVVTVVTQVVVDPEDPAFRQPSKPIGGFMDEDEARTAAAVRGWDVAHERGRGWRRVVPSPRPQRVVESWAIQHLVSTGAVVIGCGGGGIPVVQTDLGLRGVPAVIDKDRASALLAEEIGAVRLVFSTGVSEVSVDFALPTQRPLGEIDADSLEQHLAAGQFPPGSMGPKVEAAIAFVRGGPGREAIITSPGQIVPALAGEAGTRIRS